MAVHLAGLGFSAKAASLQRYVLYCEFLVIGVVFGFGKRHEKAGPKKDWLIANRKSLRQAFFGLFSVFLVVFALKDVGISRSFFFSYLPWLYASLLFTNYWLPLSIGQWAFSGDREERAALVGTLETADRIQTVAGAQGIDGNENHGPRLRGTAIRARFHRFPFWEPSIKSEIFCEPNPSPN